MIRQFGEEDWPALHHDQQYRLRRVARRRRRCSAGKCTATMDRYMGHMIPMLSRGSHPVVGPAAYRSMDVIGVDGAEIWDMGFSALPSRRDFLSCD